MFAYSSNNARKDISKMLSDYWRELEYEWKKQLYLNYLLSQQEFNWRTSAFFDDSYGLEFIFCKILDLETEDPENDLVKLNQLIKDRIFSMNSNAIQDTFKIKEIILQGVNTLKPLNWLENLELVYLDHCDLSDINTLKNISRLKFYESPDYPTNKPSLYKNPNFFSEDIQIIQNPYIFLHEYFSE